jgi:hypothetical protein
VPTPGDPGDRRAADFCRDFSNDRPEAPGSARFYAPYSVVVCPGEFDFLLAIEDTVIAHDHSTRVYLGLPFHQGEGRRGIADDALGLGFPVLAVHLVSGGAGIYNDVHLYELSPRRFRDLGSYESRGCSAAFEQIAGRLILTICDPLAADFLYHASARAARVPLEYDRANARFTPARALMSVPPPADAALRAEGAALRAFVDREATLRERTSLAIAHSLPADLLSRIVTLTYSGNASSARALLAAAWPGTPMEADHVWHVVIECGLRASPYHGVLANLNGWPTTPPGDCPNSF